MTILFLTTLDPRKQPSVWSGIPSFMLKGLESLGHTVHVQPIGKSSVYWYGAIKWRVYRWILRRNYAIEQDALDLWFTRRWMKKQFEGVSYDMVFSWLPWHLSLVETNKPKLFWYDTTFIKTQPLYFADLCRSSIRRWLALDAKVAREAAAAIYPSEWARQSAILDYGAKPDRVHAIPFGANFAGPSAEQVEQGIQNRINRPDRTVRLLFVGVDWERKSGQTAVDVVRELNLRGVASRLSVVGCKPELAVGDQPYVEIIGRLNKDDPVELARLRAIYLDSDFFIMTSKAESYGIVYCEAMASGLPSLATVTGGAGYIVRNDVTGWIVEWGPNTVSELAEFVAQKWADPAVYRSLAESTYRTFVDEFNWETSWRRLGKVIDGIAGKA